MTVRKPQWAVMRRVRGWLSLARLTVWYLFMNEEDRRELRAVLRRQAWQARLAAAETASLVAQARQLAEHAASDVTPASAVTHDGSGSEASK